MQSLRAGAQSGRAGAQSGRAGWSLGVLGRSLGVLGCSLGMLGRSLRVLRSTDPVCTPGVHPDHVCDSMCCAFVAGEQQEFTSIYIYIYMFIEFRMRNNQQKKIIIKINK